MIAGSSLPRLQATTKSEGNSMMRANIEWLRWCRLCAREDPDGCVSIFSDQNSMDTSLATAIGKYFWVNIKADDKISKSVCKECFTLITSLVTFTERVNKVQAMFCLLQNTSSANPVDANEVRMQYGLLEEDWQHIIKQQVIDEEEDLALKEPEEEGEEDEDLEEEMEVYSMEDEKDFNSSHILKLEEVPSSCTEVVDQEELGILAAVEAEPSDIHSQQQEEENTFDLTDEEDTKQKRMHARGRRPEKRIMSKQQAVQYNSAEDEEDDATSTTTVPPSTSYGEEEEKAADDVDDIDLFKELKYELDEEEANHKQHDDVGEGGETDEEMELLEEIYSPSITKTDADEKPPVVKRKRGRPPKDPKLAQLSLAKKLREAGGVDPDYDTKPQVTNFRYECKFCERKYKNATSYRKHVVEAHQTAPDIPDFTCDKCPDKIFPTEKQLAMHLRTHMPLEEKLDIPCPFCEKKFTKISVMRQHVSGVHHNQKPFVCDECGRELKTLAALNEHKLVHTDDCPCECKVCHKRFKNKARLKIHSDIHTDVRYVCTECGLQLNTRRTLKMHMLVHSDEKQFECNFCGSAFKRSKALKNHLILHTGMRPYKCNFCEKSFSNGSNCRSHKKKMHPKELAEEEAQGKKSEPTAVPKLEELRSSGSSFVKNPREVHRTSGGLPKHLRELLLKAEERAKLKEVQMSHKMDSFNAADDAMTQGKDKFEDIVDDHYLAEAVTIEEDGVDEEDECDDGETVIYEIIDVI